MITNKVSIATKTGDNGTTSLFNGERVKKNDKRIEALGAVDELNAHLGLLATTPNTKIICKIQKDLFKLGAIIANPSSKENMQKELAELEEELEELEAKLPPLKNFILPSGHTLAVNAHIARTVCRRAERYIVALKNTDPSILKYLNRLSDYLFLLSHQINIKKHKEETLVV
ncbi:MAG: cob(I)yrinic acid a,c-diamide adenosyltransferase [Candidatus Gracilibacteria bacterium]